MTSTNNGKDVKSNQTCGPKGKTYFIELYKSLEARLSEGSDPSERTKHLCEAWRRVHSLCQHSAPSTHTHLLGWLQRHTARAVLQTEWPTPKRKDDRKSLEEAIDGFITESEVAKASRDGDSAPWETQLVARGEWFKKVLERPWDHPVLTLLLNPNGTPPTNDEVLKWLKEERGVTFVMRLHTLVGEKCDDIAVALTTAVMERVRAAMPPVIDLEEPTDQPLPEDAEPTFGDRLREEAGFTSDVWELLTDIEFVLLHKRDSQRCITLAKLTPLANAYHLIERLQKRLEVSPREKRLWKNAKEVAILIAQVVIARCMVVRSCGGAVRTALYCCARLLARLLAARLPPAADALATQAPTARHLHTLAQAVDNQLSPTNENMKPYVCELYVRAITAGMNELERLKLKTEKEADARSMEKTLGSWFVQLGDVLSQSNRIQCECTLTAFSLHPSPKMYERLGVAPEPAPVADKVEVKEDVVKSDFGSWANDSRSQTNFVKTSETLNMKHTQNQANVMSSAIFNEGEALGLSPELCQDLAVLLSGPRVKTLSWDMNRTLLMDNCRTYMERTHGGTRVLTRELKYLNIDPNQYQHLPEERDDDENDPYYGIERGYEHLAVPEYPDEIWEDADRTETATSSVCEDDYIAPRRKKKTKRVPVTSDEDSDPLSFAAEAKKVHKKKERPHSKERSNEKVKKKQESVDPLDIDGYCQNQKKDKPKEKKERKKKEKSLKVKPQKSLSSLVGLKVSKSKKIPIETVTTIIAPVTDSDCNSQGKDSLASVNSDCNKHDDNLSSKSELKSPAQKNPQSAVNIGLTKKKECFFTSGKAGIKGPPPHTYRMPNNHSKMNYRPQNPNTVRQHSPSDHNRSTTPSHNYKNCPDDVRMSISKLLEFRRHKAAMEPKNKPEIVPRKQAILRTDIPIQTNFSPKAVSIPDIPKSYIKNQHAEKLAELKREVDNLLAHRKRSNTKNSVIQFAKKTETNKAFEPHNVPQQSNSNSLKITDFVNVPYDRLMAEISERQGRNRYDTDKPPHTQNQPGKKSLNHSTMGQQDYQTFLKEYEQMKYNTARRYNTVNALDMSSNMSKDFRKDIRPTSRVTPVIPCSTTKVEPKTPICAKQSQPKKPENSLNTFSRLSYMHKNKQAEIKNKTSPDKTVYSSTTYQEVSSELDQIIKEHQRAQMKVIQAKNERFDRLLMKTPNPNSQELNKNYDTCSQSSQSREHPVLTNLLQNPAISISSVSQNESQLKNNQKRQKSVTPQKSSLSEKDQNDLIHLLRQQNNLNTHRSTNISSMPSTSNSSSVIANNTSSRTNSNPVPSQKEHHSIKPPGHVNSYQSSFETKIINIISNTLMNPVNKVNAENCVSAKSKSAVLSVGKTIKSSDPQEVVQKTAADKSHAKKHPVKHGSEPEKPEWQAVISDLLKHKTRSRGPNALDMALNKTSFEQAFEKSLQDPTVFEPQKSKREIDVESAKQREKMYPSNSIATSVHNFISSDNGVKTRADIPELQKISSNSKKHSNLKKSDSLSEKSIQHIPEIVKKVPQELQKKQFTYEGPKLDDPFISGIPNSDYDLLEELMDDDLRKEIGELSSDDESYNAAAQSFLKATKNTEKRVCVEYNKPLVEMVAKKPETDVRCLNACRPSNKIVHSGTQKPVIKCVNKTTLGDNSIKVSQTAAMKTQDDNSLIMTTKNVTAHIPLTTNTQSQAYKTLETLHNNQVDSNIYVSAVAQQASLQNIVLIGSELVYKGYSSIQTPVQGVSNIASTSTYVALNDEPNTTLYQTTQFAAPLLNSVIIGSPITIPLISNSCATMQPSAIINVTQPAYSVELTTPVLVPHKGMETYDTNVEINNHGSIIDWSLKNDKQQDVNKNLERKVLSEVQELVATEKIEKTQNLKVKNDMDMKKDADQERLKNKRLAIINREIYHQCGDKPIPLSYSPLSLKTQTDSKHHNCSSADSFTYTPLHSNDDKQILSDCEDGKLLISQTKNNLQDVSDAINDIESPATPDNNESKENKISDPTETCRRILLRSSNKIAPKSERVISEKESLKKSKVKLKSDVTEAGVLVDEKSSQNNEDKKEASSQKRASKRLRNKTLTITKEDKTPTPKNDRRKPGPKSKLLLKNKANRLPEKTKKLAANSVIIDREFFDIETELLGSKISRTVSEKKTGPDDDDSNVPADHHVYKENPSAWKTKEITVSKISISKKADKIPDHFEPKISKNLPECKEGQDNRSDVFADHLVNKKVSATWEVKDITTLVSTPEKMKNVSEDFRSVITKNDLSTDHTNTVNEEIPAGRDIKNKIAAAVPEKTDIREHLESKISKIDPGFKAKDKHLNLSTDQQLEKEAHTAKEDKNIVSSGVSVPEKTDDVRKYITSKNTKKVTDHNLSVYSINEQIINDKIDSDTKSDNISVDATDTNVKEVAEKVSCKLSTTKLIENVPTPNNDELKFATDAKDNFFIQSFTTVRGPEDLRMKDAIEQTTDRNESETTTNITAVTDEQNKNDLSLKENIDLDMSVTCEEVNISKTTSDFAYIRSARNKTINDKLINDATVSNRSKESESNSLISSVIPTIDITIDAENSYEEHPKKSNKSKITNNHQGWSGIQSEVTPNTSSMAKTDDDVVIIDDDPNTSFEATIPKHASNAATQRESDKDTGCFTRIKDLSDIPQSFKDGIKVDDIASDNPLKKSVRVSLPNGRKFKATVYGEVHVNLDTLFTYPSIKAALLNKLDSKKLYTMNIKQITTVAKSDPNKILSAQIQDIITSSDPVETIDLLSDDEDISPSQVIQNSGTQSFETEYGKFKILPIGKDIFTKHQNKFSQKSMILLKKVDIKPYLPAEVPIKMPDNVNQNSIIAAIPEKYVTGVINDIENKLISENKNTPVNVPEIVEIDDSSNDSLDLGKSNKRIRSDDKLNELKNVLLKELGVKEKPRTTESILQTNRIENNKMNVVKEIDSTKGIRLRSRSSKPAVISAGKSGLLNNLDKEEQLKITSRKCYVKLIRCDELAKKYEEKDRELVVNLAGDDALADESFTISEDFSILNDLDINIVESAARSSSPVIELNDVLTCLDNNSVIQSESAVHQLVSLSCEADWFTTKATLHLRDVNNAKLVWTDIFGLYNNVTDYESLSLPCIVNEKTNEEVPLQRNCARSLTSLVLDCFQETNIINRYKQFCAATTRSRVNRLKRKSSSLRTFAALKVSRLDDKVVEPKLIASSVSYSVMDYCSDAANVSDFNLEDTRVFCDGEVKCDGEKSVDTTNSLNETDIEHILTAGISITDTEDAPDLEISPVDNFVKSNLEDIKTTSHLEISPGDKSIVTTKTLNEISSENIVMANVSVFNLDDTKIESILKREYHELSPGETTIDTPKCLNETDFEDILTANVSVSETEDTTSDKTTSDLEISLDDKSIETAKSLNTDNNSIKMANVAVSNIEEIAMISDFEINRGDKSTAIANSLNEIKDENVILDNVPISNFENTKMTSDVVMDPSDKSIDTTKILDEINSEMIVIPNISVSNLENTKVASDLETHPVGKPIATTKSLNEIENMVKEDISVSQLEDMKVSYQNTDRESSPDYKCIDTTQSINEINSEHMLMENVSDSSLKGIKMASDPSDISNPRDTKITPYLEISPDDKSIVITKSLNETNSENIVNANVFVFNLDDTKILSDHELSPDDTTINTTKSINVTDFENIVMSNVSLSFAEDTKTTSDFEMSPDDKFKYTKKSPNKTNNENFDVDNDSDSILDIKEIAPVSNITNSDNIFKAAGPDDETTMLCDDNHNLNVTFEEDLEPDYCKSQMDTQRNATNIDLDTQSVVNKESVNNTNGYNEATSINEGSLIYQLSETIIVSTENDKTDHNSDSRTRSPSPVNDMLVAGADTNITIGRASLENERVTENKHDCRTPSSTEDITNNDVDNNITHSLKITKTQEEQVNKKDIGSTIEACANVQMKEPAYSLINDATNPSITYGNTQSQVIKGDCDDEDDCDDIEIRLAEIVGESFMDVNNKKQSELLYRVSSYKTNDAEISKLGNNENEVASSKFHTITDHEYTTSFSTKTSELIDDMSEKVEVFYIPTHDGIFLSDDELALVLEEEVVQMRSDEIIDDISFGNFETKTDDIETEKLEVETDTDVNSVEKYDESVKKITTKENMLTSKTVSAEIDMSKHITFFGNKSKVLEDKLECEDSQKISESNAVSNVTTKIGKINDKIICSTMEVNKKKVSDNYDEIEAKLAKMFGEPMMYVESQEQTQKYKSYKRFKNQLAVKSNDDEFTNKSKTNHSEILEKAQNMNYDSSTENFNVMLPKQTYARNTKRDREPRINLKRKLDMSKLETNKQKYRKGKNIDYPKIKAAAKCDTAYAKEYKRLLDYCSSVKFSYASPFHKENIDVHNALKSWPIKNKCSDTAERPIEVLETLFTDTEKCAAIKDPLEQTLSEEITSQYNENSYELSNIEETNFNMGFGEMSGRVIQESKDGEFTSFSAATLSDVKQLQPLLPSDKQRALVKSNGISNEQQDQRLKTMRFVDNINLKEKVRSFFMKTKSELTMDCVLNKKLDEFENLNANANWPFGLASPMFIRPFPADVTVNVVQVGQLPVTSSAQNPVTCDPRVTHVSNVSPSQCSENNSSDELQTSIKTEYTELTTADITLPLMQEYAQHHHSIPNESQETINFCANGTITVSTEIKSVVKIEMMEETSQENMDEDVGFENNELHPISNGNVANGVQFQFENFAKNMTAEPAPNIQSVVTSSSKRTKTPALSSQDKQYSNSSEQSDQFAHAMNTESIAGKERMTKPNNTTFINTSQNERSEPQPDAVTISQSITNNYTKSTPINAAALQQALAQILPPSPLNQANTSENNQQPPTNSQVHHIVHSNNAPSVINKPNGTQLLHIVQNKSAATNGTPACPPNNFSGLSVGDGDIQQNGNQVLQIVNTGNQKNSNAGQLLKKVNLLTNLANVQGSHEQKMVQFVCKSADGKSIQLPHQRSMVLRVQHLDPANVPTTSTQIEPQDLSPSSSTIYSVSDKEPTPQEMKSRSLYEENYAKFVQNGDSKQGQGKSTSLPKFNQAFGRIYQDKQNEIDNEDLLENSDCSPDVHDLPLDQITDIGSPPTLTRKPQTEPSQHTLVQQIKQTIPPVNIQTMHGGVIYTRQIPVNLGNGQTINLITVPSTEMVDDSVQNQPMEGKFRNQEGETPIIKLVPSQPATTPNASTEDNNVQMRSTNETNPQPNPQPVLTQMRIKLPMLSKAPQMVGGTRVLRPSFFQIQRNVIGGANQQVYQQLVLTTAPSVGQSIRVPAQTQKHKSPSETQSSESQMSSSTLEQLREFDMVLEQVKERSTVQPGSSTSTSTSTNNKFTKLPKPSEDTTDAPTPSTSTKESPTPVLYSIGNTQPLNVVNYVNRKSTITSTTTSSYVRSPDSTAIIESPTSSTHATLPQTTTSDSCASSCASEAAATTVPPRPKKKKPKPSTSTSNPFNIKNAPKPSSSQKPLEDEQTTQRILYILAEYKEQVENSPDKDKPAPRRRNNPAAPNAGSSKRKKSSSGSRKRDMSPEEAGEDSCRTMGSEDSSCGTSLGECNECLESHSPEEESPRKVVRRLTFEQETHITTQTRTIPQRNVIVADGQAFAVRGATGKPATTVLMPANYLLPVSMVKGGQQIAIMTNRGPKLLVGTGEGGAGGTLLLQRLIGPGGLKPVLTRPGVRHIRLPTSALHNLHTFNIATPASTVQPPDSTASPVLAPTPPDLVDTRAMSSPWPDRDAGDGKPDGGNSSSDGSEPWNLPSSSIADDYGYEEIVRTDNMDRTVLDAIPDRYSPDMEAQRIFDKMFDVDSKKSMYDSRCGYDIDASDDDKAYHQVVQRKDGRQTRLTHVSAAALRHKYAILEHELRLQKSLSEECEDLGVDSPSASELFPEAELLFAPSPAYEQTIDQCHTPQPSLSLGIPQPDLDDQMATDHILTHHDRNDELDLNLDDVGEMVTVGDDGMTTIPLDQEEFARSHAEFARSHPNTTFHTEPEDGEIPPYQIAQDNKGRHVTYHAPGAVLAPQTTVISQATVEAAGAHNTVKFTDIDNMINAMPSPQHPHINNIPSVLVKDGGEGLTKFDRLLNESRQMSNAASAIVHSSGNGTQVIRRLHYETRRDARYADDPDAQTAAVARMRDRRQMQSTGDDASSSERHSDLFWDANPPARPERRRFEFDSNKSYKSPYDDVNLDSSGIGAYTRLDSVIKAARSDRRRSDGSADNGHPPLRTYPPKRPHPPHTPAAHHPAEAERTVVKSRVNDRCHDVKDDSRRRASNRGVVKRGCHCCNGSTAPPKPKKSRPKKPSDFHTHN